MPRKKKHDGNETPVTNKRTKHFNDLQTKIKIIEFHEEGATKSQISKRLGIPWSTVDSIVKNKERFKKAAQTISGDVKLLFPREDIFVEMEKQLVNWIHDEETNKHSVSANIIREKAMEIFTSLKEKDPECKIEFCASKGWFYRFLKRTGLKCVVLDGEACVANAETAEKYTNEFSETFSQYKPEQVFYFCETVLFWKRMPESAFSAQVRESEDPIKDKMTVMVGSSALGDFKIKPLIVYAVENPKELEDVDKDSLPVTWKSSRKARITRSVFNDWFLNTLLPNVENYLKEKNVERKAILLLDKVFSYSYICDSMSDFMTFMRVPRNTSPNLQPIDQRVPSNFKRYYLKIALEQCFRACSSDKAAVSASEIWKQYNVKDAVMNIVASWNETCENSLAPALKNLWPDRVISDSGDSQLITEIANKKIVVLANKLGLHFSEDEVENLITSYIESPADDNQVEADEDLEDSTDGMISDTAQPDLTAEDLEQLFLCVETIKYITSKDPIQERGYKCCKTIESACLPYKTKLKKIEAKAKQARTNSEITSAAKSNSEELAVKAEDFLFL